MIMTTGKYVMLGGIISGAIAMLSMISNHPVLCGWLAISAGAYFVGQSLDKKS